ncbi:MAG TPA: YncE family protein [Flavilitoribacter sp.]|nr:YncE family protein [Flavilitoribacter sp.]HMQ88231.1 YncE family protein [Flavilitoribacter sp.]
MLKAASICLWISGLGFGLSTACSQQMDFKQRAEQLGLEFVADVPLAGGTTRFDYQSINASNRRLYLAHMGSDMITVFEIDSGKVIKDIPGIPNVHGVIAVPELQRVYASATGKNEVAVIDEHSLQVISTISVGNYPDGLAYAPIQKRVFISDEHGKTVSVIDAINNKLVKSSLLYRKA